MYIYCKGLRPVPPLALCEKGPTENGSIKSKDRQVGTDFEIFEMQVSWGRLGASSERLGAVLGPSWVPLGTSWDVLGRLGPFWDILGCLGGVLAGSWERFGEKS